MSAGRRVRPWGLALASLLSALPLRAAEAPWLEVKSAHFTVVTNSGEKTGRRLAWRFEQVRAAYQQLWPWARLEFGRPVIVLAARDEATLKALVPQYWERKGYRPTSVFVSGIDRHYAALRTDIREPDEVGTNPHFNVYRNYAHLVIDTNFPADTPAWFERGLAELLANTAVREKEVQYGRLIDGNLRLVRESALIPMATLVKVDGQSPYLTQEIEAQLFDAQSWAFVHYLMFGEEGAHNAKINRFAALLREERGADAAFREALGDPNAHLQGLKAYIGRSLFSYQRIPVAVQVKEEGFIARPLTPAESAAVRAGLHVAMSRPIEARALADESRKADARLAGPWEVEALLLDGEHKKEEAQAAFAKAVELGSTSFYAHYRLAQLLWSPNMDRAALTGIATHLDKAIQLNPEYANALSFLGETRSTLGEGEEGLTLVRKAVGLEPNEPYHRLALARLLWRERQADQAKVEAQAALRRSRSDTSRKDAQELLTFLAQHPAPAPAPAGQAAAASGSGPTADDKGCWEARSAEACAKLIPAYEAACRQGDGDACGALAWLYESGLGTKTDLARAASLYDKACAAGAKRACVRHATLQAQGQGLAADVAAATAALEKLCAAGELSGCTALAVVHAGKGTRAGMARARELLKKACDGGESDACSVLASMPKSP